MFNFSGDILIEDEFLRDGLQNESKVLTLDQKLSLVNDLENAGVRRIQLGSFVHPKWVPQMSETDALFDAITPKDGVTYTALVLNNAGLERALSVGVKHLSISMSASETHSKKNTNRSVEEAKKAIAPVIERALSEGIVVRAGIQSAFGCGFEGRINPKHVVKLAHFFADMDVHEINLADTAGLGNPKQVFDLCSYLNDHIGPELSLHLHDTRGLGLANMVAGLQAHVRVFDAALGGLGGCPFIPKATGNIATEDVAFTCEQLGINTGIDWQKLHGAVKQAEVILDRRLPSRTAHVLAPPWVTGGGQDNA